MYFGLVSASVDPFHLVWYGRMKILESCDPLPYHIIIILAILFTVCFSPQAIYASSLQAFSVSIIRLFIHFPSGRIACSRELMNPRMPEELNM